MLHFDASKWTESDLELLTIPLIELIRYRARQGTLQILEVIDKIGWEDEIGSLRTVYYELYTALNRDWDSKEMIKTRIELIIDEPFKDFLRKMDLIYHHKREEGY